MSMSTSSGGVALPPGVSISPGRETAQTGPSGQIVQGMVYTLTLANGAQTSVFIPYSLMSNLDIVREMIVQRIDAINGVLGLGG